jgi:ethanolamine transporter EutH
MQITPDIREVPIRLGLAFVVISTTIIISLPVAGTILTDSDGAYLPLKLYVGLVSMLASAILIASRVMHVSWNVWVKV